MKIYRFLAVVSFDEETESYNIYGEVSGQFQLLTSASTNIYDKMKAEEPLSVKEYAEQLISSCINVQLESFPDYDISRMTYQVLQLNQ